MYLEVLIEVAFKAWALHFTTHLTTLTIQHVHGLAMGSHVEPHGTPGPPRGARGARKAWLRDNPFRAEERFLPADVCKGVQPMLNFIREERRASNQSWVWHHCIARASWV